MLNPESFEILNNIMASSATSYTHTNIRQRISQNAQWLWCTVTIYFPGTGSGDRRWLTTTSAPSCPPSSRTVISRCEHARAHTHTHTHTPHAWGKDQPQAAHRRLAGPGVADVHTVLSGEETPLHEQGVRSGPQRGAPLWKQHQSEGLLW